MKKKEVYFKKYFYNSLILSLFLFVLIFIFYSKKLNPKILNVSKETVQKDIYEVLLDAIKKVPKNDLFTIYKNQKDEILYVDYDLNNTYNVLSLIEQMVKENLKESIMEIPLWAIYDNALITNLSPKIKLKINYINSFIANVYTKVTDYGLNNALIEIYLHVDIESQMLSLIYDEKQKYSYDVLLSSKVINGTVPNIIASNNHLLDTK